MFLAIEYARLGFARTVVAQADRLHDLLGQVCAQAPADWVYQAREPTFLINGWPVYATLRCQGRTIFVCGPVVRQPAGNDPGPREPVLDHADA